ncbi:unnamed protein product [Calypogeia fissa]
MTLAPMQRWKFTLLAISISLGASSGASPTAAQKISSIVSIPSELTYSFPPGFIGNITENFIDTVTNDSSTARLLSAAKKASFISYDPEFLQIIGERPSLKLIVQREDLFADEAGIWVPEKNQVWFSSSTVNNVGNVSILDLGTSEIFTPNTSIPIVTPNGGYYFNGTVYITGQGTATVAPCIYAIDSDTYETRVVVNSYFGIRFNGPNDVIWLKRGSKSYMFFTDDPLSYEYTGGELPVLPNAVWRYDPQDQSIVPVISRADIIIPNGIAVNAEMTKLYVTDTPPRDTPGSPIPATGSPAVYSFDIDEDLFAVKKRMLGIARNGIPDGVKVDDAGRIWTAESEGIVVRNPRGKVIGVFNAETLLASQDVPMANFALAGDTLVVLALQRLWTMKLAQTVISPDRYRV